MQALLLDHPTFFWNDLDERPLHEAAQQGVTWIKGAEDPQLVPEKVHFVISNKVPVGLEILKQYPHVSGVMAAATGMDHLDVAGLRKAGVQVANAGGYSTASVVQHTFAAFFQAWLPVAHMNQSVRSGAWAASPLFCVPQPTFHDLSHVIWVISGYGRIGQAVARVAEAFGARVLVVARDGLDQRADRIAWEDALPQADVISLHAALPPNQPPLLNQERVACLPTHAVVINMGRAALVDEQALVHALEARKLKAVVSDVWHQEPPRADQHWPEGWWGTPHVAWSSVEARQRLLFEIAHQVVCWMKEKKKSCWVG